VQQGYLAAGMYGTCVQMAASRNGGILNSMPTSITTVLLTPSESLKVDAAAASSGIATLTLMENAGRAVTEEISRRWLPQPVTVLCGPGNNGGDGFVVARLLRDRGWPVLVLRHGRSNRMSAEAVTNAERWGEPVATTSPGDIPSSGIIVDALFGIGLARDVDAETSAIIAAVNGSAGTVVAVDIPTGIDGATGSVCGLAVEAALTVTFCCKKPGHLLLPGREYCGELVVADIGIPKEIIEAAGSLLHENSAALWRLPKRSGLKHKYDYGHVVVMSGGPWNSGAARLAAMAALRTGAGLVTMASSTTALPIHAAHLTSVMLKEINDSIALSRLLDDRRINVIVLGPGAGVGPDTRMKVRVALASGAAVVLDADALSSFAENPHELFAAIADIADRPVIMTPHEGEFMRLFGQPSQSFGSKVDRTRWAARISRSTVVLKGADTVVAMPDARAVLNTNAPPELATAGSGDVLAGIVAGLLAQSLAPFEAAAAAVWVHGQAATILGPGLIAEDLPSALPAVLKSLS
jgi:hydroxyethylthiazole kinase-like uncharacterized protein yjeF